MNPQLYDRYFTASDQRCMDRLADFLPERVFDAHIHLYRGEFLPNVSQAEPLIFSDENWGFDAFAAAMADYFPHLKELKAMSVPMPDIAMGDHSTGLRDRYAAWMSQEAMRNPGKLFGSVMVLPGDTEEDIMRLLGPGITSLKCYQIYSPNKEFAAMDEFLPESAWAVADHLGLTITVHLARMQAVSDPDNLRQILDHTARYPNAKLILAHSGHTFAGHYAVDGAEALLGRDNIWFDLAAVCEVPATLRLMKLFGSSRFLWGTDCPIGLQKGHCVKLGSGFFWLTGQCFRDLVETHQPYADSVMFLTEELTMLADVAEFAGLTRREVENIFYYNANELFGSMSYSIR